MKSLSPTSSVAKELEEKGFAVVPNVVPGQKCDDYFSRAVEYTESTQSEWKLNDPSTWHNLQGATRGVMFQHLGGGTRPKWFWDLRTEEGVIGLFSDLYDTTELAVSYDAYNLTVPFEKRGTYRGRAREKVDAKPPRTDKDGNTFKGWLHSDQTHTGFSCVQGFVDLVGSTSLDATFTCVPGSHRFHAEFMNERARPGFKKNWYMYSEAEIEWFKSKGLEQVHVEVPKGGMVLWDSRVLHSGSSASLNRTDKNKARCVAYICMVPDAWLSDAERELRRKIFWEGNCTSHWPYHDIKRFNFAPRQLHCKWNGVQGTYSPRVQELIDEFKARRASKSGPPCAGSLTETQKKLASLLPY